MESLQLLAYTDGTRWRAGIGDPTVMGWLTVAAYFAGALFCGRVAAACRKILSPEWMLWACMAGFLAFLGVNKQLDLQTWFTLAFKQLAQAQGWYEYRRAVQAGFIAGVAISAVAVFILMWKHFREAMLRRWQLCAGALFLTAFILVRASSFHHVDQALGLEFAGFKMNWLLELGGIGFVVLACFRGAPQAPATPEQLAAAPVQLRG